MNASCIDRQVYLYVNTALLVHINKNESELYITILCFISNLQVCFRNCNLNVIIHQATAHIKFWKTFVINCKLSFCVVRIHVYCSFHCLIVNLLKKYLNADICVILTACLILLRNFRANFICNLFF